RLDPYRTRILIDAYRGGVLASFGHNHVIEAVHEQGIWMTHGKQGQGWLCFPLQSMRVDAPTLRRLAGPGFQAPINRVETQATRRHMLESLNARRYPNVILSVSNGDIPGTHWLIRISLHGVLWTHDFPLTYDLSPLHVEARIRFAVNQTSFRIHPYSILAGALRVRDTLHLSGQVYATRIRHPEMTYTGFHCPLVLMTTDLIVHPILYLYTDFGVGSLYVGQLHG
ncbi:YceI family protein, partial [mine drainage metagenome]